MKKLLILTMLFSQSLFAYPVSDSEYAQMGTYERLCVHLVRETDQAPFSRIISSRFRNDLEEAVFKINCTDPVTGNTTDLFRSALMNPFYDDFQDDDHIGAMEMFFSKIKNSIDERRLQQCALLVKDSNGMNLMEFVDDLKKKAKDLAAIEMSTNGNSYRHHILSDVQVVYDDIKTDMLRSFRFDSGPNPETECPQWAVPQTLP